MSPSQYVTKELVKLRKKLDAVVNVLKGKEIGPSAEVTLSLRAAQLGTMFAGETLNMMGTLESYKKSYDTSTSEVKERRDKADEEIIFKEGFDNFKKIKALRGIIEGLAAEMKTLLKTEGMQEQDEFAIATLWESLKEVLKSRMWLGQELNRLDELNKMAAAETSKGMMSENIEPMTGSFISAGNADMKTPSPEDMTGIPKDRLGNNSVNEVGMTTSLGRPVLKPEGGDSTPESK